MLNVLLGVRSVEQGQREAMKSFNATKWQTFIQLEMRSLQPYLFAGMEVAIVLASELVGEDPAAGDDEEQGGRGSPDRNRNVSIKQKPLTITTVN